MKVFSVVDNPTPQKTSAKARMKATRAKAKKTKKTLPPRANISADQIRSKVTAHVNKKANSEKMTRARLAKFNADKLPDLEDADKAHVGDVGRNSPNDLATHGKLKSVIAMGAFSFSDKEKAALEKILKD